MRLVTVVPTLALALLCACTGAPPAADARSIGGVCAGVSDASLDKTLAELRANVEGVEPLREVHAKLTPRLIGATVRVRATPGMTAEWLGRALQCDAARSGPSASCSPEGCPLVPDGASMDVTSTPTGFAIAVRARELSLALAIHERAKGFALSAMPSTAMTANTR